MKRCVLLQIFVALLLIAVHASAHEVRPAYLEIVQEGGDDFAVTWKQPAVAEGVLAVAPQLPERCTEIEAATPERLPDSLLLRWRARCPLGLDQVKILGLERTLTSAFVRIRWQNGRVTEGVVNGAAPVFQVSAPRMSFVSFLALGISHILNGPDHLLFVLGLLLIVSTTPMLLKTVTAFTLAHSITLAVATFWNVDMQFALLNTLIAMSILFLGPEIVRARRGESSLTIRWPWVVAFGFGLLHGFGFATGLATLGLPRNEVLPALLFFNIGVEIGQIAFIVLVLSVTRAFRLMEIRWPSPVPALPTYAIGGLGAYWTFLYGSQLFGVSA